MKNAVFILTTLLFALTTCNTFSFAVESATAGENVVVAVKDYEPVVSPLPLGTLTTWKISERYDFSYVLRFMETYNPDEQVVFTVEGKSDKLIVEKSNGFDMSASLFDPSRNKFKRLDVKFNEGRRFWEVNLKVPHDGDKEYKILLNLYCKKMDSPCSEAYGFGTQVDKILKLKVR